MHANLAFNSSISSRISRMRVLVSLMLLLATAFGGIQMMTAETPATRGAHATARKASHPHKKHITAHAKRVAAKATPAAQVASVPQATAAPAKSVVPEMPHWPANENAVPATVTWDSHGLRIEAANSSLRQILKDVSTATGAKVSGLDTDQRVFGTYGPGPAHEVLSKLLQGSGYNILMTGDQGQGTPREILLTAIQGGRVASIIATSAPDDDDDDDDADDQPALTPSQRSGNGMQRRSPLQTQQHQQQMEGRPQQGQPPDNPPE